VAAYNNVTVSGDDWVNLNTLSGCPVGTAVQIQNTGISSVLIQESTTKPTNNNGGVLFNPHYGELSKATISGGSLAIWAKPFSVESSTILRVFE